MTLPFSALFALFTDWQTLPPPAPVVAPASIPYIAFVPFTTRYAVGNTAAWLDTLAANMKGVRDAGGHQLLSVYTCPEELAKDPLIGYKRAEKVMHEMMRHTNLKPDFFYVTTLVADEVVLPNSPCASPGIFPRGLIK